MRRLTLFNVTQSIASIASLTTISSRVDMQAHCGGTY